MGDWDEPLHVRRQHHNVSTRTLHLSLTHRTSIIATARARFPHECCGLLEGTAGDDGWHVTAVHETRNLADHPEKHFLIDPQFHIDLLRRLRGAGRSVIGCFHSHPRGRPEPSNTDLLSATDQDFLWLIAAGEGESFTLRAYIFTINKFEPIPITYDSLSP